VSEWNTDCRFFSGFSPCQHRRACTGCPHYAPVTTRVLLIQLDAMGDVLRMTSLLPAIRRAFPDAHITWLTRRECAPLLQNNPLIDRVMELDEGTLATLLSLQFDLALCPEKSASACGLMAQSRATTKKGFTLAPSGVIVPVDSDAEHLYRLGLDNEAKFFENTRSAQQLAAESLGLPWHGERYVVVMSDEERSVAVADRRAAGARGDGVLVGWNTGCGPRYRYKRLDIEDQVALMSAAWRLLADRQRVVFCLLGGGADDCLRNQEIGQRLCEEGIAAVQTPTTGGLRRGLATVASCDMVVSGDTLALHMAIGLAKPVVAWFGVTCHQEIDLGGRGVAVLADVPCRPCWLRACDRPTKCFRTLPWGEFASQVAGMANGLLRDGNWSGEHLVGSLLRDDRVPPPLGLVPSSILQIP